MGRELRNVPEVIFFADGHSYWRNERRMLSAGALIKMVAEPFDGAYWATHSAFKEHFGEEYKKHFKSFKRPRPDARDLYKPFMDKLTDKQFIELKHMIADQWDYKKTLSMWRGSAFHDMMERKYYREKKMFNRHTLTYFDVTKPKKRFDNQSLAKNLYDLPDGGYPELLVFDPELPICGQADMVFLETVDDIRYADIDDHKTNEEQPSQKKYNKFGWPLEHMHDNGHNKYMLQINIYAKMLVRHGFVPRNLGYTWYKDYDPDSGILMPFPYLEQEMNDLWALIS